ncbi:FitA-like ribbon-helix-helix domain-containing protein [Salinicola salarius]|uniref:FitA-like ribbon-helix-helix domain-containing protein n=1 Tax=Salinicola salarius TaxID=430457 RepID=UPI000DA16766|nr:plasmid stabilization protein [Salinicola salarius]
MASITIRNLDEQLKAQLRMQAASHGHSMEEEARIIRRGALSRAPQEGLGSRIRRRFGEAKGVELELPNRSDRPRDPGLDT